MINAVRRGRLSPGEMFPAGDPAYRVSYPRLRSGIKVRVVERGDPAGSPVLFVPGWGCPLYIYRRNLPVVADAGFRAIAIDIKGHGLSHKPLGEKEYSLESLVDHIEEILDALELDKPALVGHSMGATLLYHFVSAHPERARSLALLSPVGLSGVPLMWLYRSLSPSFLEPVLRRVRPRAIVKIALKRVYGRRRTFSEEDVDQYWAPTQFPECSVALRQLLHSYDWSASRTRELSTVRLPAIGMWGSLDHLIPADGLDIYKRLIPGIVLHEIEGAGHIIPEETPDEVNEMLIAHLQRGPGYISDK
jgi:pimeloyl-ACP methyl ester carboxylesterase